MDKNMRRIIHFKCEDFSLAGTLDEGKKSVGLLVVSGGNEIRIGAHRTMARLARDAAIEEFPVFRFDRRGIGDSEGDNGGFESSRSDILSALSAFRTACPGITRIVAFGNCDAATALWLHQPLPVDAMVLANPWLVETSADAPAPATARAYYSRRFRDPQAWAGLMKGAVNLRKMFGSLRTAARRDATSALAGRVAQILGTFAVKTEILLAERDGTAVAFKAQWDSDLFEAYRPVIPLTSFGSGSHSFAGDTDYAVLRATILRVMATQ
jgi:exosortase A-associated hydrolase 1